MAENRVHKKQGSPFDFDSGTPTVEIPGCRVVLDSLPPTKVASLMGTSSTMLG